MIASHRLKDIPFHESINVGEVMESLPSAIVIHYSGNDSLAGTVNWLCDKQARASAHVVVGEEGEMAQLVPFNQVAWHAGKSKYKGKSNFNNFSIGIELVNPGKLVRVGDEYQAWFGKTYPASRVVKVETKNSQEYWCSYSIPQIQALKELILVLKRHYPINMLVGHEEISPGRKVDPGPAFPLEDMRRQLMDIDRDGLLNETEKSDIQLGEVIAQQLNIRSSIRGVPRKGPLKRGKRVWILEESNDWYKVFVEETGWVKKEFVKLLDK
ncbi:N-acetylmuramoyl-L-alanine amidase [Pleionea sediminis]|uniref:N-acetylmuramoyl-L-alanine amidase n=1 Tax=Pleionea sediminis TaxID=2569479 RepID=UPI001186EAEF|nr:N-acetylmuramoyl-L-alanine amidase [Pleionea sediminis]